MPPILPWTLIYDSTGYENPANSHKSLQQLCDLAAQKLPQIVISHFDQFGQTDTEVMIKVNALVAGCKAGQEERAATLIQGFLIYQAAKRLGDHETANEWLTFFNS